MQNSIILLFSLLLLACSKKEKLECDYAAEYYPLIYKADYEFEIKNFKEAFRLYEKAFENCKPINTPLYYEITKFSKVSAILKRYEIASKFIEEDIKNGAELKYLEEDSVYNAFFDSDRGKTLKTNYPKLRETYLAGLNLNLRKEIQKMKDLDQKYRIDNITNENQIDSIDAINEKRTKEIFESIGYPNETVIGNFNVDKIPTDIAIILLHTFDSSEREYFTNKVKQFVNNGTCPPMMLGTMMDLYHLKYNRPQIYGTYTKPNGELSNSIDLEEVDENRLSIGLPTLKQKRQKDSLDKIKYGY